MVDWEKFLASDDSDDDVPVARMAAAAPPAQASPVKKKRKRTPSKRAAAAATRIAVDDDGDSGDSDPAKDKTVSLSQTSVASVASVPSLSQASVASVPSLSQASVASAASATSAAGAPSSAKKRAGGGGGGSIPARLPLVLPARVNTSTFIVQSEDPRLDLSGDVGAVGRFRCLSDTGVLVDWKGKQFTGRMVPSDTLMLVNCGGSEARVDAVAHSFVQLEFARSHFDAETTTGGGGEDLYASSGDEDERGGGAGKRARKA